MEKIKINELIDFRRKVTEKSKQTFVNKLRTRTSKEKIQTELDEEEQRDYWISSTSTIYNVFKTGNDEYYDPKIEELQEKMSKPRLKNTVLLMYKRNRDILLNFKEFEIRDYRPKDFKRHGVQTSQKIISLKNFPLYIKPTIVFEYERDGAKEIGALWLVSQVKGFKKTELVVFCEALYRFLQKHFSESFKISKDLCIAVDTVNVQVVNYEDIFKNIEYQQLDKIINEMSKF